jgi:hypothetical protein
MSDITQARKALIARILEGDGRASHAQRRAAFDNAGLAEPLSILIDKVAKHAYKVTDEDIAAVGASGLSEDQIFEIVVVPRSAGQRGNTTRPSQPSRP